MHDSTSRLHPVGPPGRPGRSGVSAAPRSRASVGVADSIPLLERVAARAERLEAAVAVPLSARLRSLVPWARHRTDHRPFVVTLMEGTELRGYAPLARRSGSLGDAIVTLGHGRDERAAFVAADAPAAAALAEAVEAELTRSLRPWQLAIESVPVGDPVVGSLATLLGTETEEAAPIPRLDVAPGAAVNDYLSANMRKQLRRARNRAVREGVELRTEHTRESGRIEGLLIPIASVHRRRDHDHGRASELDTASGLACWYERLRHHARRGELEVGVLWADREIAAYTVAVVDGSTYRLVDGRLDPAWRAYSPGRLIEAAAIGRVIDDPDLTTLDWFTGVAPETLLAANGADEMLRVAAAGRGATGRDAGHTTVPLAS